MAERLRIRARPSEGPGDESSRQPSGFKARARRLNSTAREAFRLARSILPSLDPAKNGPEKLLLHLVIGMPIMTLLVIAGALGRRIEVPFFSPDVWAWRAAVFATLTLGTLVVTPAIAFLSTLAFSQMYRSSGRVQKALVCPYCRDGVEQDGTLACARPGCGALYHRECWDECAVQYGGCAIYGCSSKRSREVSAAGFLLRLSKLAVTAALFPPRVARAVRERGGRELASTYRQAFEWGRGVQRQYAGTIPRRIFLWAVLGLPAAALALQRIADERVTQRPIVETVADCLLAIFAFPLGFLFFPFATGFAITLPYFFFKGMAALLRNELAALGRADEGGGSVIGRLAAGFGKKSG